MLDERRDRERSRSAARDRRSPSVRRRDRPSSCAPATSSPSSWSATRSPTVADDPKRFQVSFLSRRREAPWCERSRPPSRRRSGSSSAAARSTRGTRTASSARRWRTPDRQKLGVTATARNWNTVSSCSSWPRGLAASRSSALVALEPVVGDRLPGAAYSTNWRQLGRTPGSPSNAPMRMPIRARVVGARLNRCEPHSPQKRFSKPPSGWRQALTSVLAREEPERRCRRSGPARRTPAGPALAARAVAVAGGAGGAVSSKRTPPQRQPPLVEGVVYTSQRAPAPSAAGRATPAHEVALGAVGCAPTGAKPSRP